MDRAGVRVYGGASVSTIGRAEYAEQSPTVRIQSPEDGYRKPEKATKACRWREDEEGAEWNTDCGHSLIILTGTPESNGYKWCTFCRLPIEPVPLVSPYQAGASAAMTGAGSDPGPEIRELGAGAIAEFAEGYADAGNQIEEAE